MALSEFLWYSYTVLYLFLYFAELYVFLYYINIFDRILNPNLILYDIKLYPSISIQILF
jgi:hypothetical protein